IWRARYLRRRALRLRLGLGDAGARARHCGGEWRAQYQRAERSQRTIGALSMADVCRAKIPSSSLSLRISSGPAVSFAAPSTAQPPLALKALQPCDADSLRDALAFEASFDSQRRAGKASAEGAVADAQLVAHPWGFAL